MPVMWWLALTYPLPLLAIPLAVLLGQHIRGGAVAVMGGGAALAACIFWLALRGVFETTVNGSVRPNWLVMTFSAMLAIALLVCAWALALAEAFRERQWGWIGAQCLAVYLSFAALVAYLMGPYAACYFSPDPFMCPSINLSVGMILIACTFAGPLALLVYALRTNLLRHTHALPDGLVASRLDAE